MAGSEKGEELSALLAVIPHTAEKTFQANEVTVRSSENVDQQLVNPDRIRRSDPMDLVHLAETVMKGDQFVRSTTAGKLLVIVDQIRALQKKSHEILLTAKRDVELHHVACNFIKVPGHIYHLYEKENTSRYFSMLSPQEWGDTCPHNYKGSYKLEYDHSWTPFEEVERHNRDVESINKVINSYGLPSSIQYQSTI